LPLQLLSKEQFLGLSSEVQKTYMNMQNNYFTQSADIRKLQIRQSTNLQVATAISNNHQQALQVLSGLLEMDPR
jgi:hypothetical protein